LFDQKGFTFPELVIVMGVVAMLFGLVTFNLLKTQNKADVSSGVQTLVSDMKTQQGKAMMGVANQNNPSSYGIYFENNELRTGKEVVRVEKIKDNAKVR